MMAPSSLAPTKKENAKTLRWLPQFLVGKEPVLTHLGRSAVWVKPDLGLESRFRTRFHFTRGRQQATPWYEQKSRAHGRSARGVHDVVRLVFNIAR